MLSKPSTVILPLALLLCVGWERGRWRRADIWRIAPFFILALAMSAVTVIEQRGHVLRTGTAEWKLGMAERFIIAGKAVWFYAAKLLWPAPLTFVYPRWAVDAESLSSWMPLAGLIVVGIILWVRRRQGWTRAGLFGLGFFVAALLPVLGFFDVYYFRYSFVADHFQYLASAGLIAVVASGGAMVCRRTGWLGRRMGAVAVPVALLSLGALTWRQAHIYRDVETLWRDTLTKNPQCWMAHTNLSTLLNDKGELNESIWHCEQALRFKPDYAGAHNSFGVALLLLGRPQEAISHWDQALRLKPDFFQAQRNWGNALFQAGRVQEAIGHYEQALRINPHYADAHYNLGLALARTGQVPEAIEHYEQALRIKPDYAEAHNNLANVLLQAGKVQEAIGHYGQALRLQPDFADAYNNLAWLLATHTPAERGDAVRAVGLAQRACELTSDRRAGYLDTLAVAYAAAGRFSDAIATAQKAVELARSGGQSKLVGEYEARLELYRSGRTYRQPADTATPNNR
jgi:tetratricopeptide (TPR) repeat protein